MQRDSERSRKNWELGQEIIGKYLKGEIAGSDKISISLQACKTHVAMMATESNRETNVLTAVKMVYEDPKERAKYIKATMPQMIEKK
jgi:hypothetical protein